MSTRLIVIASLLLVCLVSGSVQAQSWQSAITSGLTGFTVTVSGEDYKITLTNLTGTSTDPNSDYDVLVWTAQPFNLPAPETIIEMPDGWAWTSAGWGKFEVAQSNRKYYTPPALAPGESITFRYTSSLQVSANRGGPADGSFGFLCHVAAVDPTRPGSDTERWYEYYPVGMPQTWFDHSTLGFDPPDGAVPEPGSLMVLVPGALWTVGAGLRRMKSSR